MHSAPAPMFDPHHIPETETIDPSAVERLGGQANKALRFLWQSGEPVGGFAEDESRADHHGWNGEAASGRYALTTVYTIEALLETAVTRPRWLRSDVRQLVREKLQTLLAMDPDADDPTHPEDPAPSALLLLRYALLTTALTRTCTWTPRRDDLGEDEDEDEVEIKTRDVLKRFIEKARPQLRSTAEALVARLTALDDRAVAELHPYVSYSCMRALTLATYEPWVDPAADPPNTAETVSDESAEARETPDETDASSASKFDVNVAQAQIARLTRAANDAIESLVALHAIGLLTSQEAVWLVLHAGTSAAAGASHRRYVAAALRAAVDDRFAGNAWQQGRLLLQQAVDAHSTRAVHVPSFEVVRVLAEIACDALNDGEDDPQLATPYLQSLVAVLASSLRVAEATAIPRRKDHELAGWTGDRVMEQPLIETWPTAAVLRSCVTIVEVLEAAKRRATLRELNAIPSWGPDWPSFLKWHRYRAESAPELNEGAPNILDYIHEHVVAPRLSRVPGASTDAVVVLLFGPPGTTKTTIARAVANGLRWPLISLSPGNFIEDGMERVERRAESIFAALQELSRTVVILDECDELFRARDPARTSDAQRQMSAFMTASMLPKLQDLHDRGRIVMFICTNFLDSMDPAIKRVGRIDHLVAVSPPDDAQRRKTILQNLRPLEDAKQRALQLDAVDSLVKHSRGFIRGEIVTAARELSSIDSFRDGKHASDEGERIGERMEGSRTIEVDDESYRKFLDDRKAISQPHRNVQQASDMS